MLFNITCQDNETNDGWIDDVYVHKLAYPFEKSVGSYIIKLSWVDESWDLYRFVIEGKSAEKKKK